MTLEAFGLAALSAELKHNQLWRTSLSFEHQGVHVVQGAKRYVNFSSNDYLGLSTHPEVLSAQSSASVCGSGGSAVVTGTSTDHLKLAEALAEQTGSQKVLLFANGFMANLGVVTALCSKSDHVFSDALNHASIIDAVRLSQAQKSVFAHLNYQQLAEQLTESNPTKKLVVSDHVFSMDGDLAQLKQLSELCSAHSAALYLDDAHGFGLPYQADARLVDLYMGTLSKALGCYGAFVAGSTEAVEFIEQKARSYIYTTALPALVCKASLVALRLSQSAELQDKLSQNIGWFKHLAEEAGLNLLPSSSAVQPVLIGSAKDALAAMSKLKEAGFWVSAIREPTVAKGSARLRVALSSAHSKEQIKELVSALERVCFV